MDESPDELTIKELLETYFRVEDLQKVLKSFELPFVGRKSELFERVVSLLNRRQYESEFISKVKRKVTQVYRQRVAPEVDREMGRNYSKNWNKINNKRNKTKKIVKKRYEDDDSYEESSDSDSTTDLTLESSSDKSSTRSSFELQLISKKNKNNEIENKSKKRKRVIVSSSDESNETIGKESDDSLESSSNESTNKTRKQKIKNNNEINKNQKSSKTKKITKSKKKTKTRIVYESSDSESSSDSSDSDVVQKRTVKKKFLNINLSSDSADNDTNNNNNNNNSSNTEPNNTNTDINNTVNNIEINNSESDDEIQILQIIPASEALNRRTNTTQMKSYSGYNSVFKDSSSSDTESSEDFDFNNEETQDICNNNDLGKSNPLVIDTTLINATQTCDSISEMTPQNNQIPSNSQNNNNQLSNDNTTQLNNAIQSFKETTNQIIQSFQLTNQTLTQPSVKTDPKTEVKSEFKVELKAQIKTEEKRPILQQLPPNVEQTPKLRIINTPPITFQENSPKMAETVSLRITAPTDTINFIKRRMIASGSSEVEAIDQSFKLSLICPITNKRIGLPGRSLQCQHIDCFDINTFIQLSSCKAMTLWKCPKCKLPANLPINRNGVSNFNANNIIIDGLIKHILSITDSSCDAVIFDNKAIWSPDIKNSDNYFNKTIKNEVVLLDNNTTEIIELDDDEDETPIDKVTSEIANAKSYANNTSNMLITQKQNPVIDRSNPQIERIVEFLQSGSVEPQMSRPAQNIQNLSQTQTLQTHKTLQSLLKPTEQQNRAHFQVHQQQQQQQQQQQIQKQNTIPSHQKYPTFHRNTDIQNRAPIPYTSGPQMNATHSQINTYRTNAMNQNPVVNNLSQSTAATNSSDHIKFEYDSGGLIKGVFCNICNVQIPVGTKNIEIHCNGEQHKRLKLSYNKIPNNSSQNRPINQNRPLVQSTNQMMPSFHPRASPSSEMSAQQTGYHNYNNSTTFEAPQYYTTQYQRYPNQVSQPMNPYYSQPTPQYQSSMPLPAHQTQGIPPAAHMSSQNTSQFTQIPNSYRSVAHYNQTYNPYNYS